MKKRAKTPPKLNTKDKVNQGRTLDSDLTTGSPGLLKLTELSDECHCCNKVVGPWIVEEPDHAIYWYHVCETAGTATIHHVIK